MRFLERQVEEEREANRENRRLLAAALERIPPQIEAPREEREAPESASEEPTNTSSTTGAAGGNLTPTGAELVA